MQRLKNLCLVLLVGVILCGSAVLFGACGNDSDSPSHELDGNTYYGDRAFQYHTNQAVVDAFLAEKGFSSINDYETSQRTEPDVWIFENGKVYSAKIVTGVSDYFVKGNKVSWGSITCTKKGNDLYEDGETYQEKIVYDGHEYVAVTISFYYHLVD